jgi:translation initiation factor IF-1
MAEKEGELELSGVIRAAERGRFRVEIVNDDGSSLEAGQKFVSATIGGKLRRNFIRIVPGDRVTVAVSPYDLTKGRIVYRVK